MRSMVLRIIDLCLFELMMEICTVIILRVCIKVYDLLSVVTYSVIRHLQQSTPCFFPVLP